MKRLMRHTRGVGFALLLLGMFALVAAVAVPATATADEGGDGEAVVVLMDQPTNPGNSENAPGQINKEEKETSPNKGSIKVDGKDFENGPAPKDEKPNKDNEPHVEGCVLQLDWYDMAGATSVVKFELWSPDEKGKALVAQATVVDEVNADYARQYDLSGAFGDVDPANPNQGYHVRVTVETGEEHGKSDSPNAAGGNQKHKMFWMDGCAPSTSTTLPGGPTPQGLTFTELTTTTTTEAPTTTVEVEPTLIAPAPTTEPAEVLGVSLARTGAMTTTLLLLGGLALAMGGALLFATKEPDRA